MNVLILFSGSFPGVSAGAKRVNYYLKGLLQAGVDAAVLPSGDSWPGRLGYYIFFFLLPFKTCVQLNRQRKNYKVVLIYGYGWFTYILLSMVARVNGIKLYLEVNEKAGTVYSNRLAEFKLIRNFSVALTRFAYLFMNGFVVISDAIEKDLVRYVSRGAKIIKIPILIDTTIQTNKIRVPAAKRPYMLHTGALSDRKDGIDEVFKAFALACKSLDKNFYFYLTSKLAPESLWRSINKTIKDNQLENNVFFLGNISEDDLLSLQKHCSLVVINKHVNPQNIHNFPTKLGEYMAFSRPIITTAIGEMSLYLVNGENAFIIPVHDVTAMAEKIVYVTNNPVQSERVGLNGRITAMAYFDYTLQGKRLAEFFKS